VIQCNPPTFDTYPPEKTTYNNATLRAFNMLVETSHMKIPPKNMLGNSKDVLSKDTSGNGHVSRNIRLALLSADLVEPYVSIVAVNDLALSDDIVPLVERNCGTAAKRVMVPKNVDQITIEWTVGGALEIDETVLWVSKTVPDGTIDCLGQPPRETIEASFQRVEPNGATSGSGYFAMKGPSPHPRISSTDSEPSLGPVFSATVDISSMKAGEKVTVITSARVDHSWTKRPASNVGPDMAPQAHVVNARTNPDWHFESSGKFVKGRLDWFSIPIQIVLGDYDDNVGQNQAGREITTIEVSNRFGETTGSGGATPFIPPKSTIPKKREIFIAGGIGVLVAALAFLIATNRRRDDHHGVPTDALDEADDDFAGTAPYSDKENGEVEMKGYDQLGRTNDDFE
jgi:hypothetical protein